jgi:hypothetical protein
VLPRQLVEFCKPSRPVIFSLPSALSTSPARRAIVHPTIGNKSDGGSVRDGSKDPAQQDLQMTAKKQKPKSKKPSSSPAQSRSSIRSAVVGTVFNMATTVATFGSVLLCLVVVKHFT